MGMKNDNRELWLKRIVLIVYDLLAVFLAAFLAVFVPF